jgi:uncharacterized protein (DUF433 family)
MPHCKPSRGRCRKRGSAVSELGLSCRTSFSELRDRANEVVPAAEATAAACCLCAGYRQAVRRHPCLRGPLPIRLRIMSNSLITTSPEIMGGTPVFAGTRVPVQTLFEYLEAGDTIDDFLDGFPTVTREQVVAVLETAKVRVLAEVQ